MKIFFQSSIILALCLSCSSSKKEQAPTPPIATEEVVKDQTQEETKTEEEKDVLTKTYEKMLKREKTRVYSGPTSVPLKRVFIDKTKDYGLQDVSATHLYAVDFNNDGHTDLVTLPDHYSVPVFFQFDHIQKKFIKLHYNPFEKVVRGSFLTFADFNKDHVLDVLIGTLNQRTEITKYPLRLFVGKLDKGKVAYTEVSQAFPTGALPTSSVALLDFDLDGMLDIFQANWFDMTGKRPIAKTDRLLHGEKELIFKDYSSLLEGENEYDKSLEIYLNAAPTFGSATCDVDQNGFPDILTASSSGYSNKMWLNLFDSNRKTRIFKNYAKESEYAADQVGFLDTTGGGNTFFSLCGDYNNDGIFDIVVGELSHDYDNEKKDRSSVLTGSRFEFPPKFIRTEYHMSSGSERWSQGDRRGSWIDFDSDGLLDILIDNSGLPPHSRLILFNQQDNHAYENVAEAFGVNILNPSGTIVLDINRDGRPDFLTGQTDIRNADIPARLYLFENVLPREGNRSISIRLQGKRSNAHGLGAMIHIKTREFTIKRWVEYASGPTPSQHEEGIIFGLGKDNPIEYVEVRWPFLVEDRSGMKRPFTRRYDLEGFKFKEYLEITLCESGRVFSGRKKQCF